MMPRLTEAMRPISKRTKAFLPNSSKPSFLIFSPVQPFQGFHCCLVRNERYAPRCLRDLLLDRIGWRLIYPFTAIQLNVTVDWKFAGASRYTCPLNPLAV